MQINLVQKRNFYKTLAILFCAWPAQLRNIQSPSPNLICFIMMFFQLHRSGEHNRNGSKPHVPANNRRRRRHGHPQARRIANDPVQAEGHSVTRRTSHTRYKNYLQYLYCNKNDQTKNYVGPIKLIPWNCVRLHWQQLLLLISRQLKELFYKDTHLQATKNELWGGRQNTPGVHCSD